MSERKSKKSVILKRIARSYGSYTRLRDDTGVSDRTLSKWLGVFEEKGLIEKVLSNGSIVYKITEKGLSSLKNEKNNIKPKKKTKIFQSYRRYLEDERTFDAEHREIHPPRTKDYDKAYDFVHYSYVDDSPKKITKIMEEFKIDVSLTIIYSLLYAKPMKIDELFNLMSIYPGITREYIESKINLLLGKGILDTLTRQELKNWGIIDFKDTYYNVRSHLLIRFLFGDIFNIINLKQSKIDLLFDFFVSKEFREKYKTTFQDAESIDIFSYSEKLIYHEILDRFNEDVIFSNNLIDIFLSNKRRIPLSIRLGNAIN